MGRGKEKMVAVIRARVPNSFYKRWLRIVKRKGKEAGKDGSDLLREIAHRYIEEDEAEQRAKNEQQ